MTRIKNWPAERDVYRQRAIKDAQRILRLGDKMLSQVEAGQPASSSPHLLQILRWTKAIQTEMIYAKQGPTRWPRAAENARIDTIVAGNQISKLVRDAELAIQKNQGDLLARLVGQIQVHAQDIELMLSRAG